MKRPLLFGLLMVVLLTIASGRTWTSSDGRTLEGEFVRAEGEVAVVNVKGRILRIPFASLSEEDVAFVKAAATKVEAGTNQLFGTELKAGALIDADEFLSDSMKELLAASDFEPSKVKVRVWTPQGFDPAQPQKVLWMVGSHDNEAERRKGNIGMFMRGQAAQENGWIVIAADTNMGNPRRSITQTSEADAEFHYFIIEKMEEAWPGFRGWKHACAGHSTGAQAVFFRLAQLMKAQCRVVGGFFSGCNKGMVRLASQETGVRSGDWRRIKAFQSSGDQDRLVDERDIKSVGEDLKRGGVKEIRSKTFAGNHTMNEELFLEALAWFIEEKKE